METIAMKRLLAASLFLALSCLATTVARSDGIYNPQSNSVGDYQGISNGVVSSSPALACTYTPVTTGTQGTAYTGATPSASGGTPTYTFSETGTLPSGLTISTSTGIISGTPTTSGTFASIQVKVTDSLSNAANCGTAFTLVISYQGPLDIVSGATFCYSLRACSAALAASNTNIADIVDTATGVATCTIKAKTNGDADLTSLLCVGNTVSVTTFCTVTHAAGCSITKFYDQTGNNATGSIQTTLASMPPLVLSATSTSKPAAATNGTTQRTNFSITSMSQPFTLSVVAKRAASFTTQQGIIAGANGSGNSFIDYKGTAATIDLFCGSADTSTAALDSVFIAIQGVCNGASSTVKINSNAPNTVATAGTSSSGINFDFGSDQFVQFLNGDAAEAIGWPSAVSTGNQSAISTNQQTYWGT